LIEQWARDQWGQNCGNKSVSGMEIQNNNPQDSFQRCRKGESSELPGKFFGKKVAGGGVKEIWTYFSPADEQEQEEGKT